MLVKLKRKIEYKGHVYFEAVRPHFVNQLLNFLKQENHLYNDIEINTENIPCNLIDFMGPDLDDGKIISKYLIAHQEIPFPLELELDDDIDFNNENSTHTTDMLEQNENPLDMHRAAANETVLISNDLEADKTTFTLAPGQGKKTVSVLNDEYCEELGHPHLFPTGKFGYKVQRNVPLSPVKYFNQRLLNYTQKFASDSDYIFFAHSVMQRIYLNNQINIAMRKVSANTLTARMLSKNFKNTVKQFIAHDNAYAFMNTIKGTPAYWKKFQCEVLAMVKQLGVPTFFLTLSSADLRWNDLVTIISKLNGLHLSKEDIANLSYHDRCNLLNSNPVLVARHFQYRVEVFFKEIVINGPLGPCKSFVIRIEFQVRGSPHVHSFLWIVNAPSLTKNTKNEYIQWVDNIISAYLPNHVEEPKLFELVKTYQLHRHSRTCRKYKNQICRFNFGRFFCNETIVAEPLPELMCHEEKVEIFKWRNELLKKVKLHINTELNPAKKNFSDFAKDDYEPVKSIEEILLLLDIPTDDYLKH